MTPRRIVRAVASVALLGTVALAACGDDRPGGPGTLEGRVDAATDLGAVVLLVHGDGVGTVTGVGDTRAFVGPAAGSPLRVVLVGEGSGELRFEIDVEDRAAPRPTVTVVSAVDTSNDDVAAVSAVDVHLTER